MAKTLLGHVGTVPDRRLLEEIAFLRSRVRILQSELDHLRAEQARSQLAAEVRVPDVPPAYAEPVPA